MAHRQHFEEVIALEKVYRKKPGPAKGDPRMVEAGRLSGRMVLEERGREFYKRIGTKGGQATKERYGPEFFSTIGRKGEILKEERGIEFYAAIGRNGGSRYQMLPTVGKRVNLTVTRASAKRPGRSHPRWVRIPLKAITDSA